MTEQTPEPRARTRSIQPTAQNTQPAARVPQQQPQQPFMHRGDDAAQHRAQELERQEQRRAQGYAPFRYWIPVGAQGDIIILDNDLGPCFYEHAIPGPGNNWKQVTYELCPKEYDTCPLCAGAAGQKDSYYVMFMSIIDLRPYVNKNGQTVPWNRKLIAVKAQQQNYFVRLKERVSGNLRGVHLLMTRDTQQTAGIGQAEHVASHTEEELVASFSHPAITNQSGQVIKQANADLYPYDYEQLFKRPSGEDLRRRYGGVAPAGSNAEINDAWGGTDPGQTVAPAPAPIQPAASGIQPVAQGVQPVAAPAPAAPTPGIQPVANAAQAPAPAAPAPMAPAPAPAAGGIQPMARAEQPRRQSDLDDEIPF